MEKGLELSCLPLFSVSLCSHIADTGHKRAREARYRAEASRQAGWQLREVGWRDASRSLIMEHVIYSEHSSRVRKQTIRWNFILITFYDVILRAPGWPACVAASGWGRLLFSEREMNENFYDNKKYKTKRENSKMTRFEFLMSRKLFYSVPGACVTKLKMLRLTIVIWYNFSSLSKSEREWGGKEKFSVKEL